MIQGLITAGAYCGQEMQSEIGKLPPSFLPVEGKRLFVHQHRALSAVCGSIAMTLPEDFEVSQSDQSLLDRLGILIIPVPQGLSLSQSVLFALNFLALGQAPIRILHGDTLITPLAPDVGDAWSVHTTRSSYSWAVKEHQVTDGGQFSERKPDHFDAREHEVLSGYFAIENALFFCRCLVTNPGSFVDALNAYQQTHAMKALTTPKWFDFGHVDTFFDSRRSLTTERVFNTLKIEHGMVRKYSKNSFKIAAEQNWFETIPAQLRHYTAPYLGPTTKEDLKGYQLSYEPLMPLNDLALFGRLGRASWDLIFDACNDFLTAGRHAGQTAQAEAQDAAQRLINLVPEKTTKRLDLFSAKTGFPLDRSLVINGKSVPSVLQLADAAKEILDRADAALCPAVMHGDFCFSNILFDKRSKRVKLIDPRGHIESDSCTIFGDQRYDIAKLYHSALGRYDQIVSEYFTLSVVSDHEMNFSLTDMPHLKTVQQSFQEIILDRFRPMYEIILALNVHLFLSMLPLHTESHSRQLGFLCNSYRIWEKLDAPGQS